MCIHFFSFFNREQIELANIIKPTEIEEEEEEKPPPTSIGPSMSFYPSFYLAHVIEQPIFRILNLEFLQQNFVYLHDQQ